MIQVDEGSLEVFVIADPLVICGHVGTSFWCPLFNIDPSILLHLYEKKSVLLYNRYDNFLKGRASMNLIYKLLLTINTTSWMLVIYAIKGKLTIAPIPFWAFHIGLVFLLILLSWVLLLLSKPFGKETLTKCDEFSLADNEFLPVYLGYFFVSLSVSDCYTMATVYFLVFIFTYLSQTQYFNPIYLLFGYHYYHILTPKGTKVFVIKKGKVIRSTGEINFQNLRRINDTTFIERR